QPKALPFPQKDFAKEEEEHKQSFASVSSIVSAKKNSQNFISNLVSKFFKPRVVENKAYDDAFGNRILHFTWKKVKYTGILPFECKDEFAYAFDKGPMSSKTAHAIVQIPGGFKVRTDEDSR